MAIRQLCFLLSVASVAGRYVCWFFCLFDFSACFCLRLCKFLNLRMLDFHHHWRASIDQWPSLFVAIFRWHFFSNHHPSLRNAHTGAKWTAVKLNKSCDATAGEVYLRSTSSKSPSLEACQTSCEKSPDCRSITYFDGGWCSHYSSGCTNTQTAKATTMSLASAPPCMIIR